MHQRTGGLATCLHLLEETVVSGRHGAAGEVEGPKRYKLRLSQSELLKYNMDGLKSEINDHVPRTDSHRTVSTAGLQSKGNT